MNIWCIIFRKRSKHIMLNAKSNPIFSVVIPVYNVEKYIDECLQSVLNQTFKSFEVVCVDDGSPDSSIEKIRCYEDPRIRIVRQENKGLAAARNTGINASRGMFVALLDSDDFWHPEKLERHYYHMRGDQTIGISYSASLFVDENSKKIGIGQNPKLKNITEVDIFCRNPIGNGSAPVIRKSLLRQVARSVCLGNDHKMEYFDESMRQSEDVEFWIRVALTTDNKFEGIKMPLTYYRVNDFGLSSNLDKQYNAWLYSVEKNRRINPEFYKKWLSLGSAFQRLYLSRRAVKSGQGLKAIKLVHQALFEDIRVLLKEPIKTTVTYVCSCLSLLPKTWFSQILEFAIFLQGKRI